LSDESLAGFLESEGVPAAEEALAGGSEFLEIASVGVVIEEAAPELALMLL
jgi:hypothetical protein